MTEETDKAERLAVEQAIGRFMLDLGIIENTMIHALAVLTGVPQAQAHFLLNKTGGGAMADLLTKAAKAKGIDLKSTGLKEALGTIQDIMSFRNRLAHDAIALHAKTRKWMLGQGSPVGDKIMGEGRITLEPKDFEKKSKAAWAAIKVIGNEILVKHGGFILKKTPQGLLTTFAPFEYKLAYEKAK